MSGRSRVAGIGAQEFAPCSFWGADSTIPPNQSGSLLDRPTNTFCDKQAKHASLLDWLCMMKSF
jgi:hypothetical protein